MKKIDVTWRLFSMYILIIVLTLLANAACGQIKVTQFNAKWNETNSVDWILDLKDCDLKRMLQLGFLNF